MPATREQLIARWDTEEGRRLAEDVCRALNWLKERLAQGARASAPAVPVPLEASLRERLARLPFAEEVVPQLDLRGLHTLIQRGEVHLVSADLSGARLDYASNIGIVSGCKLTNVILNGCRAIGGSFAREDCSGVSFVGATLNGCDFRRSLLHAADFRGARLIDADLREANCTEASFTEADLRFAECVAADFRGADLRGANFVEANLNRVLFDERTRLQGADLRGVSMKPELRVFATQQGAVLGESKNAKFIAEFDAALQLLSERDGGRLKPAIPFVQRARARLAQQPEPDYGDVLTQLEEAFKQEPNLKPLADEVFEILVEDAGKALKYFV